MYIYSDMFQDKIELLGVTAGNVVIYAIFGKCGDGVDGGAVSGALKVK